VRPRLTISADFCLMCVIGFSVTSVTGLGTGQPLAGVREMWRRLWCFSRLSALAFSARAVSVCQLVWLGRRGHAACTGLLADVT